MEKEKLPLNSRSKVRQGDTTVVHVPTAHWEQKEVSGKELLGVSEELLQQPERKAA